MKWAQPQQMRSHGPYAFRYKTHNLHFLCLLSLAPSGADAMMSIDADSEGKGTSIALPTNQHATHDMQSHMDMHVPQCVALNWWAGAQPWIEGCA